MSYAAHTVSPLPIVWMRCACHIWPVVLNQKIGRCGYCKQRPSEIADQPDTGRYM